MNVNFETLVMLLSTNLSIYYLTKIKEGDSGKQKDRLTEEDFCYNTTWNKIISVIFRLCAMTRGQAPLQAQVPQSVWRALRLVVCRLFLVDTHMLNDDLATCLPRKVRLTTCSGKRAYKILRNKMQIQHQYEKMLREMRYPAF